MLCSTSICVTSVYHNERKKERKKPSHWQRITLLPSLKSPILSDIRFLIPSSATMHPPSCLHYVEFFPGDQLHCACLPHPPCWTLHFSPSLLWSLISRLPAPPSLFLLFVTFLPTFHILMFQLWLLFIPAGVFSSVPLPCKERFDYFALSLSLSLSLYQVFIWPHSSILNIYLYTYIYAYAYASQMDVSSHHKTG